MKRKLALLIMLVLGSACVVNATPFSDTINFTGDTFTADGVTKDGMWINDTGNTLNPGDPGYLFAYTYAHNVSFSPEAAWLNSAFLDVTFTGNQANSTEAWFIYELGDLSDTQNPKYKYISLGKIGGFSVYTGENYDWATQTFDLSAIIAGVSGSNWSVSFSVDENTLGENESMFIASSTLRGDYEPVPEPSTILLFGVGLAGLVGYSRKRAKK
jgi:hypothetical protein